MPLLRFNPLHIILIHRKQEQQIRPVHRLRDVVLAHCLCLRRHFPDAPVERQFPRRWTFYIDPQGRIAAIVKAVKPQSSGPDIVANLKKLNVPRR